VTNVSLTFDDSAPVPLRQFGRITSGTYLPTDYPPADTFPTNAPAGPYGTNLNVFRRTDPNGIWQLFVLDDQTGGSGTIGAWTLTVRAHSQLFTNPSPIIVSNTAALGVPYPSALSVTNISGLITKVTVTLFELAHTYPSDLDLLLVGPAGDSVVLMSDAGGSAPVSKITLTFDDLAIAALPSSNALQSGTFKPTDFPPADVFPSPAPNGPYGTTLSVFNGKSANGTWRLFVVDDFSAADGGQIAGGWGLAISTEPLAIVQQPVSQSVVPGSNANLYVSVAASEPVTYQWRLNGAAIPGATNPALSIPVFALPNAGSYSISVASPLSVLQSDTARLLPAYPLTNAPDAFASGQTVVGSSGVVMATNFFATKEPNEPYHGGKQGGSSVWYSWTPNADGIATFDTRGSTFDTLLGVYTGTSLSNLTLVACDDDSGGFYTSMASFNVAANLTYRIAVDGMTGDAGTFLLNWSLEPTLDPLPVFSIPPPGITVSRGSNVTLSVSATAPASLAYQWSLNGAAIPGATSNTLSLTNLQSADVGTYQLTARTAGGRTAASKPIVLEIGLYPEIQSRAKAKDVEYISTAWYSIITQNAMAAIQSLMLAAAKPLYDTNPFTPTAAGTAGFQIINNFGGSSSRGCPCSLDLSQARYLGFAPQEDGEFFINTSGSSIPTKVEVYRHWPDPTPEQCIASTQGFPSALRFVVAKDADYIIATDSTNGSTTGVIQINWGFGALLAISKTDAAHATLSWYAPSNAYHLQSTLFLSNPPLTSVWSLVTDSVIFNNRTNTVVVPTLSPPANRFFRLVMP
jgi:subtilisin-like proprotein convertase family protein